MCVSLAVSFVVCRSTNCFEISFKRRRSYAKQANLRHYALANQRFLRSVYDDGGVAQDGCHTPNNRLTETCNLGLLCTSLILDIHVMIN